MPQVYFLPDAEAETSAAQEWYDMRAMGLGDRFFAAVDSVVSRMADKPEQFPVAHGSLRRAMIFRFPYALIFRIEAEGVYVVACAHTSRAPFYWRNSRQ